MKILGTVVFLFCILFNNLPSETCCRRCVGVSPMEVPAGESGTIARGAFESVFTSRQYGGGPALQDCPLQVEIMSSKHSCLEYIFKGKIRKVDGIDKFILDVELLDISHGQVVKKGQISWTGSYKKGIGFAPDWDYIKKPRYSYIRALATTFQPLDKLIHEYEAMPEQSDIKPEKEEVEAGEEITIQVTNILDSRGKPAKPFQRILAKVKKGEIKNGIKVGNGFSVFEVGSNGSIELEYKAPDECKKVTEIVSIWNSCKINEALINTTPAKEIANKEFEIVCNRWKGTIEYEQSSTMPADSPLRKEMKVYQDITTQKWKLEVVLARDSIEGARQTYKIQSAKLTLEKTLINESENMKNQVRLYFKTETKSEIKNRSLTSSECNINLVINKKSKKYMMHGSWQIKNVPSKGTMRMRCWEKGVLEFDRTHPVKSNKRRVYDVINFNGQFEDAEIKRIKGTLDQRSVPEGQAIIRIDKVGGVFKWDLIKIKDN